MSTLVRTDDVRILDGHTVLSPESLIEQLPLSNAGSQLVSDTRMSVGNLLRAEGEQRLLVVVGPCSVHDPDAALEYGRQLIEHTEQYRDELLIVMRVYFEKPRSILGWKGLINDPKLDGSFDIDKGLYLARKLLLDLLELGLPAGSEYLDLITPQYIGDLVSWGAIGARTTESQGHRELASGLSCPIGFKNGTSGATNIAIDAIKSARHPHHFMSVTKAATVACFASSGNRDTHIILRGGKTPNYDPQSIAEVCEALGHSGLEPRVMVDMSHGNSGKVFSRQVEVCESMCAQLAECSPAIMGVMMESNLVEGNQPIGDGKNLVYGQSVTDGCMGWEDTKACLDKLAQANAARNSDMP